jgi:hypothetical protein
MRLYINDQDIVNVIGNIDDQARQITIEKNQTWFNNGLESDTIDKLFRNSLNKTNNTMLVLISDTNEPTLYVNGIQDDDFNLNELTPHVSFTLTIEAQGLLIYPKKFGIRWVVKSIYITNDKSDDHIDNTYIDKESIEESWKNDISEIELRISEDIHVLESRIETLKTLKTSIDTYYNTAIQESEISYIWHESLNLMKKKYVAYLNGSV